jgi:hypothetical protein
VPASILETNKLLLMSERDTKIIHIQPIVRNWDIFTKGAKSAGFDFSFAAEDEASLSLFSLKHHYRDSVPVALPDFFKKFINSSPAFILRSDDFTLLYQSDVPKKVFARLYSRKYTRPKLRMLGGRILCQLAQQYSYLYLVNLLDSKDYMIVGESINEDLTIMMTLRRWNLKGKSNEDITVLAGPQKEEIQLEINPQGLITIDLSPLEPEQIVSYTHWLSNHLGYLINNIIKNDSFISGRKEPEVSPEVSS